MMTREDREALKHEIEVMNRLDLTSIDEAIEFVKNIVQAHPFSYFSILPGRRFQAIWQLILEKTKFLDEHLRPNAATRIYYFVNKLDNIHVCETCGKPYAKQLTPMALYEHFHCNAFCA